MVSELKEPIANILEKCIVFQLKFIRQIFDFLPQDFDEEEENIAEIVKQLADYDISAQTLRKIQPKHSKNDSDICLHRSAVTQIPLTGGSPI